MEFNFSGFVRIITISLLNLGLCTACATAPEQTDKEQTDTKSTVVNEEKDQKSWISNFGHLVLPAVVFRSAAPESPPNPVLNERRDALIEQAPKGYPSLTSVPRKKPNLSNQHDREAIKKNLQIIRDNIEAKAAEDAARAKSNTAAPTDEPEQNDDGKDDARSNEQN